MFTKLTNKWSAWKPVPDSGLRLEMRSGKKVTLHHLKVEMHYVPYAKVESCFIKAPERLSKAKLKPHKMCEIIPPHLTCPLGECWAADTTALVNHLVV